MAETETRVVRIVADAGTVVCERCRVADSVLSRTRGLLGRSGLAPDEGLLIRRTSSVHTHFMRFPIDVVFLDAELRVVAVVAPMRPWRLKHVRGAQDVLELAEGASARARVAVGDRLLVQPTASA